MAHLWSPGLEKRMVLRGTKRIWWLSVEDKEKSNVTWGESRWDWWNAVFVGRFETGVVIYRSIGKPMKDSKKFWGIGAMWRGWSGCGVVNWAWASIMKGDEFEVITGQKCWLFELGLHKWRQTGVNRFESYLEANSVVWTMDLIWKERERQFSRIIFKFHGTIAQTKESCKRSKF